jgi:hypothetical protein
MLRFYEIEGSHGKTAFKFLGNPVSFNEANLLEEDIDRNTRQALQTGPNEIKTIRFNGKGGKR